MRRSLASRRWNAGWRRIASGFAVALILPACGGGGGGGTVSIPGNTTPYSVTDNSGDFAITINVVSSSQMNVSWEDPTARYSQSPISKQSTLYRDGQVIATGVFGWADAGLQPATTYCYRAEVTAVYAYVFPYSYITVGWSSGTACVTTLYGLRVLWMSPLGEGVFPTNSTVSATFNGNIDPSSVTSDSFYVAAPFGRLTGSLSVSGSTVTFRPDSALVINTRYTATLKAGIRDLWGYSLPSDCSWPIILRLTLNTLYGVWGSSGTDVFAVGASGTILHFDGSSWTTMDSGSSDCLLAVWGTSGIDVFAVAGAGTILHYNGSVWTSMSSKTTVQLTSVWGASGSDVFVVGWSGTILHYNGSTWEPMASGTTNHFQGVWGSSSSDVFAVSFQGTIHHYDGISWSLMYVGTTEFQGVWGSSGSDVIAVGIFGINSGPGSPLNLHYNGTSWGDAGLWSGLLAVWGSLGGDVFAVGAAENVYHFNGSSWSWGEVLSPYSLLGIWGSSGSDIFVVGGNGTILHYDGSAWAVMF